MQVVALPLTKGELIIRAGWHGPGATGTDKTVGMILIEATVPGSWMGKSEIDIPQCSAGVQFAAPIEKDPQAVSIECAAIARSLNSQAQSKGALHFFANLTTGVVTGS
jgi:predicted metal-dependent RNase